MYIFVKFSMFFSLLCSQVLLNYLNFLLICINIYIHLRRNIFKTSKMLQVVLVVLSVLLLHCQPTASLAHHPFVPCWIIYVLNISDTFCLLFMKSKLSRLFIIENTCTLTPFWHCGYMYGRMISKEIIFP